MLLDEQNNNDFRWIQAKLPSLFFNSLIVIYRDYIVPSLGFIYVIDHL